MLQKRKCGIDIFRIMCCMGVLGYHIMDDIVLSTPGGGVFFLALYFLASFCVPGFFLLSGYLLAGHEELDVEYSERKVIETMTKLFGWVIFWSVIHYIRTGEIYDIWSNFIESASGRGILPVAWFLFTYCLLMLVGYIFFGIKKKYPIIFLVFVGLWMIALAMNFGRPIIRSKTQSLWLHLYIGYFILGMSLNSLIEMVEKILDNRKHIFLLFCMNIISLIVYAYQVFSAETFIYPHNYYGQWYYTTWLISLFWISSMIKVDNNLFQKIVLRIASNTFVVYLGHLPILLYITSIYPLQKTSIAIAYIIIFFIALECMAEVFRKMPLLRKLV